MRDQEPKARVIQLLPAEGWRAVFGLDDGDVVCDPLICWALVEFFDREHGPRKDDIYMPAVMGCRQAIVGMTTSLEGWVDSPEGSSNFLGYAGPGEGLDEWSERAAEVAESKKRQQERKP